VRTVVDALNVKAYRADWSYAGEEVAEGLFGYMRREVCNENVGSLVWKKMSAG
jgi:hypothetical protein